MLRRMRRSYEQLCTLARTLDVVGERWTLLIVRELMLGPRRFTDLVDGLPGIGRNLLSARLRALETAGLVSRRPLPAPSAAHVYELTGDGRALGPALAELGRWGAERLPDPEPELAFRPAWAMFPLAYMADREAAIGKRETYEFRVGDTRFHFVVDDGEIRPEAGGTSRPDVVVTMSEATLATLFARKLEPAAAVLDGRISIEGDRDAVASAMTILAGSSAASESTPR